MCLWQRYFLSEKSGSLIWNFKVTKWWKFSAVRAFPNFSCLIHTELLEKQSSCWINVMFFQESWEELWPEHCCEGFIFLKSEHVCKHTGERKRKKFSGKYFSPSFALSCKKNNNNDKMMIIRSPVTWWTLWPLNWSSEMKHQISPKLLNVLCTTYTDILALFQNRNGKSFTIAYLSNRKGIVS